MPTQPTTGGPAARGRHRHRTDAGGASRPPRRVRLWSWLRWPVAALAAVLTLVVLAVTWLWFTTDLPPAGGVDESAIVVDRNGEELAVLSQGGTRVAVALDELPAHVADAVVAAEDRRFHEHTGVDPVGVVRALWNNLTDDDVEGGSTITQQLVKNVYLDSDRTIGRKLREAVLAVKLERAEDKGRILERYLNTVYFGRGAYGIEAAARAYFDVHAPQLDHAQAAMLAGMLQAPEAYDPVAAPSKLRERRDQVLEAMVQLGAVDRSEAEASKRRPIRVVAARPSTSLTAGVAPHFIEQIRAEVIDRFSEDALYRRGLVVRTTLDLADQRAAEAAVAAHLDDPDDPQAAVVGLDRSGAVRAWVGGRDFQALRVDLVSGEAGSGRQPGSTFKPVVLAAHLAEGHGAGVRYAAPAQLALDVGAGGTWTVRNAGGASHGVLSLAEATVQSVNTVYAQAALRVGPQAVADLGHDLGVTTELQAHPSLALGTGELTPIELASVYSTFAREGRRIYPYRISRIEGRNGRVLLQRQETEGEPVLDPDVANAVSGVLAEVPRRGTATAAALDRPMAAKTGTTQRNADAWLAGYTPEYTAVVWVGGAGSNEPMGPVDGERVHGGSIPARIWHDFMTDALADVPPTPFPPPPAHLLGDTEPAESLTASPSRTDPGGTVAFEARGLSRCIDGWWVSLTGPTTPFADPAPAADGVQVRTIDGPVQGDLDRGEVTLRLPASADEGVWSAELRCDAGGGALVVATTELVVGER